MGSPQADISRGREAMAYFHNASCGFSGYSLTLDQLIESVAGSATRAPIFLDGLGMAIREIKMDTSELRESMENLADAGRGRIPSNQSAFFKALSDQAQNINWVTAAPKVLVGVTKDVIAGVAEGGESVIASLKSLNMILPLLIVGGVVYVVVQKIKKAA